MRRTHFFELKNIATAVVIGIAAAICSPAMAQVAPSASEAAAYTGLHAAAQKGDVTKIEQLAASKADVNARDGNGRTPLHVATFAKQRDAIRALVKAGADINLLDKDRYDGVTIAKVATCSGVRPLPSRAFRSALAAASFSIFAMSPFWAAACSPV